MHVSVNGSKIFFDVTGTKVRVRDGVGIEVPTLLILHGGPGMDHMSVMTDLLPLADHYQLVWIDHRGNGRSSGDDPALWTLAQWARDVHDFCIALNIVKPIVLGQSFGGHVAQAYAARYPEHPGKLILSSILAHFNRALTIERFRERGGDEIAQIAADFWSRQSEADRALYRDRCYPFYGTRESHDPARAAVIVRDEITHHYLRPDGEFQTLDLSSELANIRCPTLVLAGTEDPVIPWEQSKLMADAIVNAPVQYVQVDGCGHGIWRDEPEQARAILTRFIDA